MKNQFACIVICALLLTACGGNPSVKPTSGNSPIDKQPNTTATNNPPRAGGYYLDDGPGDNPPQNIDSIPHAVPKKEPYLARANKPYKALGAIYTPMTTWQPYKERGVASWYGKRYHGKKTASGEVYDMYSMSGAHTTLPLPSYVKVTNPANGRFVVVRINDRGPFKSSRLIDLSYVAAYQLRFASHGSTVVEIEAIDPNNVASYTQAAPVNMVTLANNTNLQAKPANAVTINTSATPQYYVQVGAFKNEANAEALSKKIQSLQIAPNVDVHSVYNNDFYRLKLGPFDNKFKADSMAAEIRKQLNLPAIITNQ